MESHLESQSAPGLVVSDIWKMDKGHSPLATTKSEGSNISHPNATLEAVAAALDNFDHDRHLKNKSIDREVSGVIASGSRLCSRTESEESKVGVSPNNLTSFSRCGSQNNTLADKRPRSISDIVQSTEAEQVSTPEVVCDDVPVSMPDMDNRSAVDASSLRESGRIHNPSTSSQPESIDSTCVNIMQNKDTASTVAQTGSIGDPEGSGMEGSDLVLARRSSSLSHRRRTSLQRRRRDRPGAVRRRRRTDSGVIADVLFQAVESGPAAAHVASSYEDTTPGALHYFQDEFGMTGILLFVVKYQSNKSTML